MMTAIMFTQQIIETTEIRRHNGQCGYGDWLPLDEAPGAVIEAVVDAVIEAMCRDHRREAAAGGNTDDAGTVEANGAAWVYLR